MPMPRTAGRCGWMQRFQQLFETTVRVLPLPTGTVANAIALAAVTPPWGSVLCHDNAHIYATKAAPRSFTATDCAWCRSPASDGKLTPASAAVQPAASMGHGVHSYAPAALSLTQCTEAGTVYTPAEMGALCAVAGDTGLATHLDGARFANAVAQPGLYPG